MDRPSRRCSRNRGCKASFLITPGFARRHLADDRDEHRVAAMGDRGHLHRHADDFKPRKIGSPKPEIIVAPLDGISPQRNAMAQSGDRWEQ
jgi:hypothetical protein